ncbi:MAG: hypothetical protein CFE24_12080 [Flavobacterium sp. BFFFF2]|nr:MAG: hypothetical protein CFE24_12080 [Flavobacterium sp. BFFFF2]
MSISILVLFTSIVFGQKELNDEAAPIVAEGKLLYKSEMASWYGTDLFLENYKNKENIEGYFSYTDNGLSKCVFFSKSDNPVVIGTISFDNTYDVNKADKDFKERAFTSYEKDLYAIRKIALAEVNADTLFKRYNNTNLNFIPLIKGKERKVYILTGPQKNGVVIFGNDYLLTFNKKNKLLHKKQLHKNIIPIYYGGKEEEGKQIKGTVHNHLPETGDFITATDICTLMLYEKFAKWETHHVVSEKYVNMWDCETDELKVITVEALNKINEDDEQRQKNKPQE